MIRLDTESEMIPRHLGVNPDSLSIEDMIGQIALQLNAERQALGFASNPEIEAKHALKWASLIVLQTLLQQMRITVDDARVILDMEYQFAIYGFLPECFFEWFLPEELVSAFAAKDMQAKELIRFASRGLYPDGTPGGNVLISRIREVNANNYPGLQDKGIGFINGMDNQFAESEAHALRLSEIAEAEINLVYNATHGILADLEEAIWGKFNVPSINENLLLLQWEDFFEANGPDAKFLQICHSKGAIHVKNALSYAPPSIRDRIIVLAVAPISIITPQECFKAFNIVSDKDEWIKCLHRGFPELYKHLEILKPSEVAIEYDHSFNSPTYQNRIKDIIESFLNNSEGL